MLQQRRLRTFRREMEGLRSTIWPFKKEITYQDVITCTPLRRTASLLWMPSSTMSGRDINHHCALP